MADGTEPLTAWDKLNFYNQPHNRFHFFQLGLHRSIPTVELRTVEVRGKAQLLGLDERRRFDHKWSGSRSTNTWYYRHKSSFAVPAHTSDPDID